MSAWLCGNLTLSACVEIIKSDDFQFYDDGTYSDKSNSELMDILSDLNTKSLNCRYGKSRNHILEERHYCPLNVDDGQRYKSVSCYLYQTCECQENEEHPLFKALENWVEDNEDNYDSVWMEYYWDLDNPRFKH